MVVQEATLYFLDVLVHASEALGLALDEEIDNAMRKFRRATGVEIEGGDA